MPTITDLVTGALIAIRAARAGYVPAPEDLDLGATVLNELLNVWNADDRAAYSVTFSDFTLTPNLSPHTHADAACYPLRALHRVVKQPRFFSGRTIRLRFG